MPESAICIAKRANRRAFAAVEQLEGRRLLSETGVTGAIAPNPAPDAIVDWSVNHISIQFSPDGVPSIPVQPGAPQGPSSPINPIVDWPSIDGIPLNPPPSMPSPVPAPAPTEPLEGPPAGYAMLAPSPVV